VIIDRLAPQSLKSAAPLEDLPPGLDPALLEHRLHGFGDLAVLGIAAARGEPRERQLLTALLHHAVGARRPAGLREQRLGSGTIERIEAGELHGLLAQQAPPPDAPPRAPPAVPDVVRERFSIRHQ